MDTDGVLLVSYSVDVSLSGSGDLSRDLLQKGSLGQFDAYSIVSPAHGGESMVLCYCRLSADMI